MRDRDEEVTALQDQVTAMTAQLHEMSDELESRMAFVADAMTQIESLETQLVEAKHNMLTRDMQLHNSEQQGKVLESALQVKEKECEHWESEYRRAEGELLAQKAVERELNRELESKAEEERDWKAEHQSARKSLSDLKSQNANFRKKERKLVMTLRQHVEAAESKQRLWESRLAKRETKIETLQEKCCNFQEELARVQRQRLLDNKGHEQDKEDVAEQHSDEKKQSEVLQQEVRKLTAVVEQMQTKEQHFRQEILRLREHLLLSESRRETEHRRHTQLVEGKEKEVTYIWQKYVEIMAFREEAGY